MAYVIINSKLYKLTLNSNNLLGLFMIRILKYHLGCVDEPLLVCYVMSGY
jgi:hypothetical protein